MKRLYLHIGQPKTATTTIQSFLANNQQSLMRQGWLYPESIRQHLAHHPLGNFFREKPLYWVKQADPVFNMRMLRAEVDAAGCQNVIMSTETLFFAKDVRKFKDYFDGFEVFPVVFLRRQDHWFESAFREQLKNGAIRPHMPNIVRNVENFLKNVGASLDYSKILRGWSETFSGRVIVIPFEKTGERKPVELKFLEAIGAVNLVDLEPAEAQNESFNRDALTFFSGFSDRPRIGLKYEIFKNVLAQNSSDRPDPPDAEHFCPPALRAGLVAEYDRGNREIARELLGTECLFTSPPPDPSASWTAPSELSSKKAIEIAEFLANGIYGRLAKEK